MDMWLVRVCFTGRSEFENPSSAVSKEGYFNTTQLEGVIPIHSWVTVGLFLTLNLVIFNPT